MYFAETTNAFIDRVLPILEGYRGPDRSEEFIIKLRGSRGHPEAVRGDVHRARRPSHMVIRLRQYSIPFFATQIGDLAICGPDFQRAVLNIRYQLDLFNQDAISAQSLFDKTFSKPTPEDLEALRTNLEHCYRDAGMRAEIIMEAIAGLAR